MDLITFKFSAHRPSGETMHRITQRFRSAITCSRSRSIVPNLLGLGLRTAPKKDKKCGVFCLFVCPSNSWTVKFVLKTSPERLCDGPRRLGDNDHDDDDDDDDKVYVYVLETSKMCCLDTYSVGHKNVGNASPLDVIAPRHQCLVLSNTDA